jgi:predicted DNA-binding transcriptional regulator AlpA
MPLATPTDLARELKEPRRTIYNWIDRTDFPAPAEITAGGLRLWDVDEVRKWRRETKDVRKPGRPKS